jgi:hypothetical protein
VNPDNPVVSLSKVHWSRLNSYRVWKPLGLLVVARLTPPEWEVFPIDENLHHPGYGSLPKPDLVGIMAFTSQATRTYEAKSVWKQVLEDARTHAPQRVYRGGISSMAEIPPARHDLPRGRYYFSALQTTRGCPLNCSFCGVTVLNGGTFRHRPGADVVAEPWMIQEKVMLFVDDNLSNHLLERRIHASRVHTPNSRDVSAAEPGV